MLYVRRFLSKANEGRYSLTVKSHSIIKGDDVGDESKEPLCAANGCDKKGTMLLKVWFINKWLTFCEEDAKSFMQNDLILSGSVSLGIGEGKMVERDESNNIEQTPRND